MNKSTTMNIRMDEKTRQELKDFAIQVGIPASSLVNASIRQMLRSGQVTFTAILEPTPYLEKIMREADADIKADRNMTHTLGVDGALAHLDSLMKK